MFRRILIANRGEIACRVIRTARRLGIETVAVYSDADRKALHVREADLALHIGAAPAMQSYLRGERVLEAARDAGAEAIHPGYGFLSENAVFARACEDAGIVFIGPPADAIEAMGSKARAKAIMAEAGVPLIPGYHGDDQDPKVLQEAAEAMGFPVLLKATAGGGGKGMRAVARAEDFDQALAAARREASASFDDDRMLVEKLIERPRHVEVQVFCDATGAGVYLADRDCSIQRRHQKVIEEAPAPGLADTLRRQMGETAVRAAQAIAYRGAGTIEFLLDPDHRFYFMEMNTRLQVEHPVTEWICGQDLVEWQLRIAAGESLPHKQEGIRPTGHAIEARVYAEDPGHDFLPSTGCITHLRPPTTDTNLRIDTGIEKGSEITPHYDPMLAKVIAGGADREEARRRLAVALRAYEVAGPTTNLDFLHRIVASQAFARVDLDTQFIDRHQAELLPHDRGPRQRDLAAAACLIVERRRTAARTRAGAGSPWANTTGWRLNLPARQSLSIDFQGDLHVLTLEEAIDGPLLDTGSERIPLRWSRAGDRIDLELDRRSLRAGLHVDGDAFTLFWPDATVTFREHVDDVGDGAAAAGRTDFAAPMHGTVVAHLAQPGVAVAAGDPVIVIEAMKMEQTMRAPVAGTVEQFLAAPGDLVDRGEVLVDFTAAPAT